MYICFVVIVVVVVVVVVLLLRIERYTTWRCVFIHNTRLTRLGDVSRTHQ